MTENLCVVRVGTLSKTLGSLGGFVAGPRPVVELLVNLARPYIFTTAQTPGRRRRRAGRSGGACARPEGAALCARLAAHVERVAPGHPSPIVPVVLGSEERALAARRPCWPRGCGCRPSARPPCPEGTSRLRVTLSAAHTDGQVDRLARALAAASA